MSDPLKLREKLRWTAEELEKDLERAQCRGRTLCLKIKLHTFEVLTRQVVTPRAICSAEDLYNYSLPILVKLEQEITGMKLRLMGLRCTHLVSTKKPDTKAFFGLQKREKTPAEDQRPSEHTLDARLTEEDTQIWQDLDTGECLLHGESSKPYAHQHFEESMFGKHGKEVVPNPKKHILDREAEWWDCPVCFRPQEANERLFNDHIDLCLSRQTIRDAVQCQASEQTGTIQFRSKPRSNDRKRGKGGHGDPKQKRLSFI
jgi:DNA polymerase kappa